jgi:hypothetical protein
MMTRGGSKRDPTQRAKVVKCQQQCQAQWIEAQKIASLKQNKVLENIQMSMTYYEVKKVTQVILQAIASTLSQFPSIVVRESMM